MRLRTFLLIALFLMFTLPLAIIQTKNQGVMASNLPVASFTYTPEIPSPGEAVTFNASASNAPGGAIVQYAWDFGDGNTGAFANPVTTHSYPADGNYTVELTITDNSGLTNSMVEVVPVMCVEFFRVVYMGTLIPAPNVQVTAYYYNGKTWTTAPASNNGVEIKYDNATQPKLASTSTERFRNPGYTASILLDSASNIGWEIHHGDWPVYFKFSLFGSIVATWPNTTSLVYSYKKGFVESHTYLPGHQAYWDPSAGTYVIRASDIAGHGVSPSESHPIIVGLSCPPPQAKYYLNVKTNPTGITTIPGTGLYLSGTNVTLTAPTYVNVSSSMRYRLSYWDVDGTSRGNGVNPTKVLMTANHTAAAHYVAQYSVIFAQNGINSDASGAIVTVNSNTVTFSNLPYILWVDSGSSVTYSYNSPVASTNSGKQYRLNAVTGPTSPITVTSGTIVTGNYVTQYQLKFAQTGLDSTATGTVVTVNGSPKAFSVLPYILWVNSGSSVTYSYAAPVSSSVSGRQFRLASVSGSASPITVTSATTITGNYVVQYFVTFTYTGLDSTAAGTVVTVNSVSQTFSNLPYSVWVDSGNSVTYAYTAPVSSSVSGKQFRLTSVTGPTTPITVTSATTLTGNYAIQYKMTFSQSGVGSDFTGTIVTIDNINYNGAGLPVSFWFDSGSGHNFAYASPLVGSSRQYAWSSTSGLSTLQSGTLTAAASGNVVGNYVVQNQITFDQVGVTSDFTGTVLVVDSVSYSKVQLPVSFSWNVGSVHTFAFQSPLVVSANAKQYLWTGTTGLSSMQSGSLTVSAYGSIIANYKTQYYLTVTSAHDSPSPVSGWFDSGTSITDSVTSPVPGGPNTQYACTGWSGSGSIPASGSTSSITFTIVQASSITWNWKTQYQISFAQSGVGTDFLSTVVTVDSVNYATNALPVSFWFDSGSTHAFNYCSPLVVSLGKQYAWSSTTGLTGLQNGILTITNTGSVTGNYITQLKYQIAFAQSGVGSDFNGTIVIVDGNSYNTANIPTFLWDYGSIHSFAFQSSLSVGINSERYVWTSTGGLSSSISGSITVTTSGSLTGNYKTQYYLNVITNPIGVASPSGTGWYDANTQATVSTSGFVDISPGLSRHRFNGWTTVDMSEITQPTQSPTTVTIDKPKTVTALYAVQYKISFSQTGVGSDFTGKIVTIDINDCTLSNLPAQLWYDNGSTHAFTFNSPLVVSPNTKQYVWISTSGLSTTEAETITISSSGTITGNYKTQFYLTITSPHGTPAPGNTWVDAGTSITESINSPVPGSSGTQYVCTGWTGTGSAPPSGTSTMTTFTMNQQTSVTWNWKTQYYLSVAASPPGIATISGQGWYDPASHEPLTAPAVPGFAFQYWDVDGSSQGNGVTAITVDMNAPHVATANYATLPQITVTIDPTTATITAGQTVSFTSAVTGGVPPFSYQWYLNSNPVSGATSSSWYFTPTTPGTYYVYLAITDSTGNTGQSATARITINPTPVGGYSISLTRKPNTTNIGAYAATIIVFGVITTAIKRKRK